MKLKTLRGARIRRGARIIIRADFDVALERGAIRDDFRMREVLPTLEFILRKGGQIRIVSHLGRPRGRRVLRLSMRKIAAHLAGLLKRRVVFIRDPFSHTSFNRYNSSSDVLFFENIRFWPEEEENDAGFADRVARWGDLYVNEAFSNSHRCHASMVTLAALLPSFAGFRLEKEISALSHIIQKPRRPFAAVLGGAKLETKMPVLELFLKVADTILVGGALATEILSGERLKNKKILLPRDGKGRTGGGYADIGPETIRLFTSALYGAKTVVWSGPLGRAELPQFAEGTKAMARVLQKSKAFTVVGGGDTLAILKKYNLLYGFDHVSTGGGAMLEFLAGKKLPGIEALRINEIKNKK